MLVSNARLLANLRFPRLVLPVSALVESAIGFVVSLGVLLLLAGALGQLSLGLQTFWLVPAFIVQTMFNVGLASLAARVAVPFRDLGNVLPYLLRFWLYLSPIIWPIALMEEHASAWIVRILEANPMYSFIWLYRTALLGWEADLRHALSAGLWAVGIGLIGVWAFVRSENQMVRYL